MRSAQPASTFRDTLRWQTRNLVIGAVRNWARTAITWNLALDAVGGPHVGGCDTCTGVVTVDGGFELVQRARMVVAHKPG